MMINAMTILESILSIANNIELDNNERYIATKVFEYCLEIDKMTLTEFLNLTNINNNQFKRFYQNLNCPNYATFKQYLTLWCEMRKKQLQERCNFEHILTNAKVLIDLTNYIDLVDFLNLEMIDAICNEIKQSKRIIMYGSPAMLNFSHDLQIDLKMLGKNAIRSSLNDDLAIIPHQGDFIWFFTMTNRTTSFLGGKIRTEIFSSNCKKLLITQNEVGIDSDYVLKMNLNDASLDFYYILLFYFDLLKVRYYLNYKED